MIRAINRVIFNDASWRKFFALNDIDFMHVEYESFIQDGSGIFRQIASHIGVETDHMSSLE
jgi:LPS sulfotransferase NodH